MINNAGFEIGPNSSFQRFNRLWDVASIGTSEERGSIPTAAGSIISGSCTTQDGSEQGVILRTLDMSHSSGSQRPAHREIEVHLDNGAKYSVSDVSLAGNPEQHVVESLAQLEQIVPTFR